MKHFPFRDGAVLAIVAVFSCLARANAQDSSAPLPYAAPATVSQLSELLNDHSTPQPHALKDLNASWWRLHLNSTESSIDMYAGMMGLLTGESDAYFTQGRIVNIGGEAYLVAYHPQLKTIDMAALMRIGTAGAPAPEKLRPDTPLALSLVNLRSAGSLNDIVPFDLARELGDNNKAITAVQGEIDRSQTASLRAESRSNLKQLGLGMLEYEHDYDETLPPLKDNATLKKALMPYVRSPQPFLQPGGKQPYRTNPILSGKKVAHISDLTTMIVMYEAQPDSNGMRAALFLDGHVKSLGTAEWNKDKRISKIK